MHNYKPGEILEVYFVYETKRKLVDREYFYVLYPCKQFQLKVNNRISDNNMGKNDFEIKFSHLNDLIEPDFRVRENKYGLTATADKLLLPYQGASISWNYRKEAS